MKRTIRLKKFDKFCTTKRRYWIFVLFYVCIVVIIFSAGSIRAQESEVVDRIVAVVNNDIITLFDLNRATRPYEKNIKALHYTPQKEHQTLFQIRKDILDRLIDSMLADQQIKRDRITVTEKEINTTIERIKEARSLTNEQLRERLASEGLTMEGYRTEIKEQILRTKLVNREVKSKIVITKEDIQAYYDSNRDQYAGKKKYYLWNIFAKFSSASDSSEKKAILQQMEAISAKLKQGQSFENLVKEIMDSSSIIQGNDLGWYRLEELSEQLRTIVKNMKIDEFSQVMDTDLGYQILYVKEIQQTPEKPLEEVESEIQQVLYNEFVDNKYQEWLDELRTKSHIRVIH